MPKSNADRNLLLGILALQMDFVRRDDLIRAMNTWVLAKHRSLGEIFREQGALNEEHFTLLEALVAAHLKQHSNDPEKSLAAVSSITSFRAELEKIDDSDIHICLTRIPQSAPDHDPLQTLQLGAGKSTSNGLRFRVLRPHARGGLGEVFVASDDELHREVALKQIQDRHADDSASRARFMLEAEITGGLEHPGIVPVYGLGTYADGRPYYAMRFIRGDSLEEAIGRFHKADAASRDPGERTLELRQLLGRFIDVCNAIEYAHSRGVLHRDLKPGNIMLGKYGETLVVDWGLAKLAGRTGSHSDLTEVSLRPSAASGSSPTEMGNAIGTPAYMSPEQADGRLDILGRASDVYSLGATLYTLLSGRRAFQGRTVEEVLRKVRAGDFQAPRQVKPQTPVALEAICLKAMSHAPENRYQSPRLLADDLEHWMADEPVAAQVESLAQRLSRFGRRHRAWVRAGAAALIVIAGVSLVAALLVNQQRKVAEELADQKEQLAISEKSQRERAETKTIEAEASAARARAEKENSRRQLYRADMLLVNRAWEDARVDQVVQLVERHEPDKDLQGFEWHYHRRLLNSELRTISGFDSAVEAVQFSADGRALISFDRVRGIGYWDSLTGQELRSIKPPSSGGAQAIDPNGEWLAIPFRLGFKILNAENGEELRFLEGHPKVVSNLTCSRDGRYLASISIDGMVKVWDTKSWDELRAFKGDARVVGCVSFNSTGTKLAFTVGPETLKIFDIESGNELQTLLGNQSWRGSHFKTIAFSPDDRLLVSGGLDRTIRIWDTQSAKELQTIRGHLSSVSRVLFSPDGRQVVSASADKTIKFWDVATGECLRSLIGHETNVADASLSPDGRRLASCGWDRTIKVWDAGADPKSLRLKGHSLKVELAFSPDGRRLASAGAPIVEGARNQSPFNVRVKVWHTESGEELLTLKDEIKVLRGLTYSSDGRRLITASGDGTIRHWDAMTGDELSATKVPAQFHPSIAFGTDDRSLFAIDNDGVLVLDIGNRTPPRNLKLQSDESRDIALALSRDGTRLATATRQGGISLIDPEAGKLLRTIPTPIDDFISLAFSPDRSRIAWAGVRNRLLVFDADTGEQVYSLEGGTVGGIAHDTYALTISPDGRRLAAAKFDGKVLIYDLQSGDEICLLTGHESNARSVVFSPDGRRLASGSQNGTILLWNAAPLSADERMAHFLTRQWTKELANVNEVVTKIKHSEGWNQAMRDAGIAFALEHKSGRPSSSESSRDEATP